MVVSMEAMFTSPTTLQAVVWAFGGLAMVSLRSIDGGGAVVEPPHGIIATNAMCGRSGGCLLDGGITSMAALR